MLKIYITTARVLIVIAIAVILMLLILFKLQHWQIGMNLVITLGVLVAIMVGDVTWSRSKKQR